MSQPDRRIPSWVLPAGLGALVITLVAIALIREPVKFDPGTPEGTVQEYLVALSEERWDDALEIVHDDWRGTCESADVALQVREDFTAQLGDQTDAAAGFELGPGSPESPSVPEEAIQVEVTIQHGDPGTLGSGWSELTVFELIEEDDFWWLVGDPWPYFTWSCRGSQ